MWQRAGLQGLVPFKGGICRVVIRQLRMLGIVGLPIPTYDTQTGIFRRQAEVSEQDKVLF